MWLLKDIVLVVGYVIMTVISIIGFIGLGFNIKEIHNNIGIWNLTWLELGFIILVIAFWVVTTRLIIRLGRFERKRPIISVNPKVTVGREITLEVHNKGHYSETFSADMTCSIIPGERQLTKVLQLINASMIWESSGTDTETINAGRPKVLKVCYFASEDRNGLKTCNMNFYKRELSRSEIVPCAEYVEGDMPAPKVRMNITFGANLPFRGRNNWNYEISYVEPTSLLSIRSV